MIARPGDDPARRPDVNQHWRHIGTGALHRVLMVAKNRPSDAEETVYYVDAADHRPGAATLERFIATHWRTID